MRTETARSDPNGGASGAFAVNFIPVVRERSAASCAASFVLGSLLFFLRRDNVRSDYIDGSVNLGSGIVGNSGLPASLPIGNIAATR